MERSEPFLRLLGPIALVGLDSVARPVRQPRCATLLAVLACSFGRPVSRDCLVDRVWGDQTQPPARGTVHALVAHCRALLDASADHGPVRRREWDLVTTSDGYQLDGDPAWIDLARFRSLMHRAALGTVRDPGLAAELLTALDSMGDELLAGARGRWAEQVRDLLAQEIVDGWIVWGRSMEAEGRWDLLVTKMRELLVKHPLVEPFWEMAALGLHHGDRTAEALVLYHQARQVFRRELGVEPGGRLPGSAHPPALDDHGRHDDPQRAGWGGG